MCYKKNDGQAKMKPIRLSLLALLLMSACGGNPFLVEDTTGTGSGTGTVTTPADTGGITTDGGLPPGTASPKPNLSIVRSEPKGKDSSNGDSGNGYVTKVIYNSASGKDEFLVDNLGFDGNNVFERVKPNGDWGGYAIYDGKVTYNDSVTGTPISQLQHRMIYGVSPNSEVSFAIVRTGSYVDYGFGGFIYQRSGGVTLPKEGVGLGVDAQNPDYRGQAHFEGTVAGLRDFKARGGMEMTTADMQVDIDYGDFNDGNAVKGVVYNRKIFDLTGTDELTDDVLTALTTKSGGVTQQNLPVMNFTIGPGVMNDNGEIVGLLDSSYTNSSGTAVSFDAGKYYALVSGAGVDQKIVGVFVVESADPRYTGVTARETGGYILNRK